MAGYYSEPLEDPELRKDSAVRATMTKFTRQLCFASTGSPLFTSVLTGPNLKVTGSKFFIEGEYTFAYEPDRNHSCIEVNHISFNSTNNTKGTKGSTTKPPRSAQDSARKRDAKSPNLEPGRASSSRAPTTPQQKTRAGNPSSSIGSSSRTPYAGSLRPSYAINNQDPWSTSPPEFGSREVVDLAQSADEEVPITPSQRKKGKRPAKANDSGSTVRRGKRQKKATPKAAESYSTIMEEAEEAGLAIWTTEMTGRNIILANILGFLSFACCF